MKKSLIIITVILILAALTNPNQERHKEVLMNKMKPELSKLFIENSKSKQATVGDAIGIMITNSLLEQALNSFVQVDNYVFFSITKLILQGEPKAIAIGAFGNLLFYRDIDEFRKIELK